MSLLETPFGRITLLEDHVTRLAGRYEDDMGIMLVAECTYNKQLLAGFQFDQITSSEDASILVQRLRTVQELLVPKDGESSTVSSAIQRARDAFEPIIKSLC